ncbi:glucan 1,4-beta-glucosidase [Xanthomonas fragariae]|nr:glucan 1,4-beta-glucosidase [Xanthomonas fragariae]
MHSHPAHLTTAARRALARGVLAMTLAAGSTQAATPPPYLDTQRAFDARATDLVSRMTLEQKAAQMQNDAPAIARLHVPA